MPPPPSWRCRLTDMVLTCNLKFPNFLWGFMSPASGGPSHLKQRETCVTAHAEERKMHFQDQENILRGAENHFLLMSST